MGIGRVALVAGLILTQGILASHAASPVTTQKRLLRCYELVSHDTGLGLPGPESDLATASGVTYLQVPVPGKGAYLVPESGGGAYFFQYLSDPRRPLGTDRSIFADIQAKFQKIPDPLCLKISPLGLTALYSVYQSALASDAENRCTPATTYEMTADEITAPAGPTPSTEDMKKAIRVAISRVVADKALYKRVTRRCARKGQLMKNGAPTPVVYLFRPDRGRQCSEKTKLDPHSFITELQAYALPALAADFRSSCALAADTPELKAKITKFGSNACKLVLALKNSGVLPPGALIPKRCAPKQVGLKQIGR